MTIVDRIDELEVGVGSAAFWGLGRVGVAVKGPTGVRRNGLSTLAKNAPAKSPAAMPNISHWILKSPPSICRTAKAVSYNSSCCSGPASAHRSTMIPRATPSTAMKTA